MKLVNLTFLFLFFALENIAQEGTNFEPLTFQEALKKSEKTGKKIFIDCYTKTCGPCKYMAKFIFPLKACGDYFNPNYVCIMKDMEEGDGKEIAERYNVGIYPTFLIVNSDGSLYCRHEGAVTKPEDHFERKIMELVEKTQLGEAYHLGNRDEAFLKKYIAVLRVCDKKQLQIVMSEIMIPQGVAVLCQGENWNLIKSELNNTETPLFQYIVKNREAFSKYLGRQQVGEKIISTYTNEFYMYKSMGLDFEKRMKVMEILEEDRYDGALPLKYCMLFRHIIDEKQFNRVNEILLVLRQLSRQVPDESEKLAILQELSRFEKIATPEQVKKVLELLDEIYKEFQFDNQKKIQKIISELSR